MRFLLTVYSIFTALLCFSQNIEGLFIPRDAQVTAVGEAAHGNQADNRIKTAVINTILQTDKKVRVFVEMPQGATYAIRDFFNNRIDSFVLADLLQLYSVKTDAFYELLETYRQHPAVQFYGIDMQSCKGSVGFIIGQLAWRRPDLEQSLHQRRDTLWQSMKDMATFKRNLDQLHQLMGTCADQFSKDESFELSYALQTVDQFYLLEQKNRENPAQSGAFRDSCMAENVLYLLRRNDTRAVIIAANYHVANDKERMGSYLKKMLGERYYIIGTQFYAGTVLSVVEKNQGLQIIGDSLMAPEHSLPADLYKLYPSTDICIPLNNTEGKLKKILTKNTFIQDLGAGGVHTHIYSGYHYARANRLFDAVYFNPRAVAAKPIRK